MRSPRAQYLGWENIHPSGDVTPKLSLHVPVIAHIFHHEEKPHTQAFLYGELMARYVTTIPSSLTQQEAFAYMADIRNFAEWDKGVVKVVQVEGSGAGLGTIFDVTVKGLGKSTSILRYITIEYDEFSNILVRGVNTLFTSVDRVTINQTATGCEVIYDATLTANWIIAPMNIVLGKVFNKIGDTATRGLRKVLA